MSADDITSPNSTDGLKPSIGEPKPLAAGLSAKRIIAVGILAFLGMGLLYFGLFWTVRPSQSSTIDETGQRELVQVSAVAIQALQKDNANIRAALAKNADEMKAFAENYEHQSRDILKLRNDLADLLRSVVSLDRVEKLEKTYAQKGPESEAQKKQIENLQADLAKVSSYLSEQLYPALARLQAQQALMQAAPKQQLQEALPRVTPQPESPAPQIPTGKLLEAPKNR